MILSQDNQEMFSITTNDMPPEMVGVDDALGASCASLCSTNFPLEQTIFTKNFDILNESKIEETGARRVHFNEEVVQRHVMHLTDYSTEEKVACWYSSGDFYAIQRQASAVVEAIDFYGIEVLNQEMHCARGLERFTEEGAALLSENTERAWDAVFDEQYDQSCAGIFDPKALAKCYRVAAIGARFPARKRALQDYYDIADDLP